MLIVEGYTHTRYNKSGLTIETQLSAVKVGNIIERARPNVCLRNENKMRFRQHKEQHEKYLKSPLFCGIKLWDPVGQLTSRGCLKGFGTYTNLLLGDNEQNRNQSILF